MVNMVAIRLRGLGKLIGVILGILPSLFHARATTINAASTSYADVSAAVNLAANGDTVQIPSGSASWSQSINITKPLVIVGAGQGSTVITNTTHATSGLETPCFYIHINVNERVEISALKLIGTYSGGSGSNGINIVCGSVLAKQIVIHDVTFEGFSFGVYNGNNGNGVLAGVVYNCTFNNVRTTCRNSGFNTIGDLHGVIVPSPAWGTDNYVVYEDNTINFTNWTGGPQGSNYMGDTEYPMNYVVRYCTFNINRTGAIQVDGYDMHGNIGTHPNGFGFIIHDNVFWYTGSSVGAKLADIRGGVGSLIFNNRIHGQNGCYMAIRADPSGSVFPSLTYTWNNTQDAGSISDPGSVGPPAGYTEIAYPHPLRFGAPPTPTPTATPHAPEGLHMSP